MLKMPDTKTKYFSVKYSTKIQGVHYTPSVCYPLPQDLRAAIEEMAARDMAKMYPEKVRFVTGVAYPVKKPETGVGGFRPSSVSLPKTEVDSAVKPGTRKSSPSGFTLLEKNRGSRKGREFD
jgi:hypothetical protein